MDYSKLKIGEPSPGAAFPVPKHADGSGLSKREHFALQILVAILCDRGARADCDHDTIRAVAYADSLIAMLDRKATDATPEAAVD